jgi:hypothetical protein
VTVLDPALLRRYLAEEPFISVGADDTVILCVAGSWTMEQVQALGTYLHEWAPDIKWQAVHDPGFTGVIHIRADQPDPTAPIDPVTPE